MIVVVINTVIVIILLLLYIIASCLILYFVYVYVCVPLFPDLFFREVDQNATAAPQAGDAGELCCDSLPPLKHQCLLSRYKAFKMQDSTTRDSSITAQISKYLDNMNDYDYDALTFW